jgi:hypothetical protein
MLINDMINASYWGKFTLLKELYLQGGVVTNDVIHASYEFNSDYWSISSIDNKENIRNWIDNILEMEHNFDIGCMCGKYDHLRTT